MSENQSICCPDSSHEGHKKTLLFMAKDGILAFCKMHGWIRLTIMKNGQKIDFEGATIIAEPVGKKHINNVDMPIISIGNFEKK
jgi:hypothetical protein